MMARLRRGVSSVLGKEDKADSKAFEVNPALVEWQEKLKNAMAKIDFSVFDIREQIYGGTHMVDKNINERRGPSVGANNVRNIAYEMIESQIDTTIPQPAVKAKRKGIDFLAQMIEDSHMADMMSELPIQRINDEMERVVPVQGQGYVVVGWNPDYTHREFVGQLEITHIHPKQLIPQPGVFDIQDMDYFFILSSVTRDFIRRRFDVDVDEDEREEYPQISQIEREEHTRQYEGAAATGEKVTLITCWYRDDEGEIGRICWVNDTLLEDSPCFFHRRQAVCQKCGMTAPQGTKDCECGGKMKVEQLKNETIDTDMELEPLVYSQTRKVIQRDPFGRAVAVQEEEQEMIEERFIPAGTQIPYYSPKRYPIAVRTNTPKSFALGGMSDIDIIRDQQDSIKKTLSKIESKILQGGSYLTKLKNTKFTPTNRDNQVIEIDSMDEKQALGVITMQADIGQDMNFYLEQYRSVQSTLGINDSYQGKKDTTATSGKAKEIQVQRTAGRLLSKSLNKYDFYKQLYEIMFEFKLAFYDEARPFIRRASDGSDDWGDFNKYQFLLQDATGEWFYCTDFIFNSDSGQGIPNDKMWLYEQLMALYQAQAIDLMMLWTILEQLKFPSASMILSQIKERQEAVQEQQQAMAGMAGPQGAMGPQGGFEQLMASLAPEQAERVQQIVQSMSPEAQQKFMALPPEQMEQALMAAMQSK